MNIMLRASTTVRLMDVLAGDLANDIGKHLNCGECNAMCDWLEAHGDVAGADNLRRAHAMSDDEGDEHWELRQQIEKGQ